MNKQQTKAAIEIMQHFVDGGKLEMRGLVSERGWVDCEIPTWSWSGMEYRKKYCPTRAYAVVDKHGEILTMHLHRKDAEATANHIHGSVKVLKGD